MSRKKFLAKPRMKPMIMLATVFVLSLFVLILSGRLWEGSRLPPQSGTVYFQEKNWVLKGADGEIPVIPGQAVPMEAGNIYTMSTELSYDGRKDPMPCCFLQADHMFCQVLLDGEALFSFEQDDIKKPDRSRSPGFLSRSISLPEDCQGKLLELRLQPVLPRVSNYPLPYVNFGDFRTVSHTTITRDLYRNVAAILCIMMGISALIFSAASFTGSDYREGFNIGSFSLLVALYFLTDCRTNFYFISNPYYLYFVNYLTISLMPMAFMGVMRECHIGIQRRICTVVITLQMAFFLSEMYLHFSGIMDMRELLPILHGISLGEMGLNTLLFLTLKDRSRKRILQFQLPPVLIGMVLDIFSYLYHWNPNMEEGMFTTAGVLLFLFFQLTGKLISQARKMNSIQQQTIEGMATLIEGRDGSTGAHVRNTGVYARMIAKEMYRRGMYPKEIDSEFIDMIGWMAPLHDVGKIKISDTILNKPGKFTPEEYEIMKTHAAMGGEIIAEILKGSLEPEMMQMAVDIATHHHERWDGKGYPDGLKGAEIPLCARIMAAADVFDALTSKRVYKPEMSIDEVFQEMRMNEDKQFQKEIVEVVLSLRPELEAYIARIKKAEKKAEKRSRKEAPLTAKH